jgi:uncharacterized protein (DUF433 family)
MATARAAETYPHISKDSRICGGKACIEGTRIRVLDVVGLHRQGYKPEDMLEMYASSLTLAQVHAALAYYYDHSDEIEGSIEEGRKAVARIQREQVRFFKQRRAR